MLSARWVLYLSVAWFGSFALAKSSSSDYNTENEEYGGEPPYLTPDEVAKLEKVFRFVYNLHESPVFPLLKGGQLPDTRKFQGAGLDGLVNLMRNEPSKGKKLIASLEEYADQRQHADRAESATLRQTDGMEGCRLDYGAFVEPITNRLYNIIREYCIQNNISPFCKIIPALPEPTMPRWGLRMLDCMGKIAAGLAEGDIHWPGAFQRCHKTHVTYENTKTEPPEEREFHGQHCRLTMRSKEPADIANNLTIPLYLGVCVPDTCSPENVTSYILENAVLGAVLDVVLGMDIVRVYCGQVTDISTDTGMLAITGLLVALFSLVVLASLYDWLFRKRWLDKYVDAIPMPSSGYSTPSETPPVKAQGGVHNRGFEGYVHHQHDPVVLNINNSASGNTLVSQKSSSSNKALLSPVYEQETKLSCFERFELCFVGFSAYSNFRRIWRLGQKEGHISVLNGVRSLTMCWTIMGNTGLYGPIYAESWVTENLLPALRTYPKEWSFQAVLNYHFASDTYFLLGGLLSTYWWLNRHAQRGRLTWGMPIYYVVHKYWRLIPALMVFLGIYACSYRYLADGPLYPMDIEDADNCRAGSWWKNLLLIFNLSTDHMCLGFMWYIPVSFQLHLAGLVVLIPLVMKPIIGYVMMAAMFISHIAATAAESSRIHGQEVATTDILTDYFITPWCRAGPYIIGMALGKILFEIRKCDKKIIMHPVAAILGWVLGLALVCTPVYVTYDFLREGGVMWGKSEWVAYDTLARSSWGLGVSWIIFACYVGYGGLITKFLSYFLWLPLSRVGYMIMIINGPVIYSHVYASYHPLYLGPNEELYRWLANLLLSVIAGVVLAVLWQYPLSVGLGKVVMCRSRFQWLKCGRHPREKVAALEKAYNRLLNGDAPGSDQGHLQHNMASDFAENPTYGYPTSSTEGLHKRDVKKSPPPSAPPASDLETFTAL